MTKQQSARVWVAVDPNGKVLGDTARHSRCHAIEDTMWFTPKECLTWAELYRRGWRIKRARVVVEG